MMKSRRCTTDDEISPGVLTPYLRSCSDWSYWSHETETGRHPDGGSRLIEATPNVVVAYRFADKNTTTAAELAAASCWHLANGNEPNHPPRCRHRRPLAAVTVYAHSLAQIVQKKISAFFTSSHLLRGHQLDALLCQCE